MIEIMDANGKARIDEVKSVAERIGVSRCSVYREIHEAGFPVIRVGRRILLPKKTSEALEKAFEERRKK